MWAGRPNDVGFVLEDGVYKPIISEYDERQGRTVIEARFELPESNRFSTN